MTDEDLPIDPESELPALIPDIPPPPRDALLDDAETEVTKLDLVMANNQVRYIHHLWNGVRSISAACQLIDAGIKATKHRRVLLKLPYDTAPTNTKLTWEP